MSTRASVGRPAVWGARLALLALLAANVALVRHATAGGAVADVAAGSTLCAGLAGWAWYLAWRDGVPLSALVGPAPRDRRAWGWVALALPLLAFSTAAMLAGLYALSWVAPGVVEGVLREPDVPPLVAGHPLLSTSALLMPVVAGPAAEELFFRGALLDRWTARWGARRALVGTAALFGALHADPLGAVAFGACMALLRWRTGTLLVPIACHALHNALVAGVDLLPGGDGVATSLAELRAGGWAVALALPAAALALWGTARRLRGSGARSAPRAA